MHDVGKLFIPERILNKPGALTEDEFAVIKTHPQVGAEVLRAIPDIERVAQAVESHHEAFDGSGYPLGLKGENIPLYGRIIAVADAYVNMTSDRSFAPPKTDEQAMAELGKMSGTRFDGMIVRLFARLLKMEKALHSRRLKRSSSDQSQHQLCVFGQVALAAKPVFHRLPQLIQRDIRSNFQAPVGHRQRVVKHRTRW